MSARRCSAVHTDTPYLVCERESGHDGWHRDETYGFWNHADASEPGDPGVMMPSRWAVDRFNREVEAAYSDLPGCVGVTAVWGRRG